jgi:anaerobic selenocysteine-containing dehydrogenase
MTRTSIRTCPLCEATCGLSITLDGDTVTQVRGDADDVFSHGYVCPKGVAIGELHHDPARLRHPVIKGPDGRHHRATWDEAWAEIGRLLGAVRQEHGDDAVAVYLGNPNVHNAAATIYGPAVIKALGTPYVYTASTVDQMPQQVAVGLMYGTGLSVAVPDIDRTDYLLVIGGNPMVSNGSMWTAPNMPGRLRALKARGGRLVVIDPIRTRTAEVADEHVRSRPGTDAFLVASMVHVLLRDGLVDLGAAGAHLADGALEQIAAHAAPFTPDAVAQVTGVPADTIERLAAEVAGASSAAVYGRMGTSTAGVPLRDGTLAAFGTAGSWWIALANLLTGNVDRAGGVMFPLPAVGGPTTSGTEGTGRGIRLGGGVTTRVRGLPSALSEFPVSALAEEIDTPDAEGRHLRALITIAGNPVVSTPHAARLDAALASLDAMVSIDAYITETSRHAHVILPAPSPLARPHVDLAFASLSVRNVVKWSPPSVPLRVDDECDEQDEADTLLRLACVALGDALTVDDLDVLVATEVATRASRSTASPAHGLEVADMVAAVEPRTRVARIIDLMIRSGPYGDGFGRKPGGLTLADVEAAPHGIDLGPLESRLPGVLRTPSGRIEAAEPRLLEQAERMARALPEIAPAVGFVAIGRRGLRSNNSWMHNVPLLAGGANRCTLWLHPDDASDLGVADGGSVRVASAVGTVVAVAELTDAVSRGVVSLPHGWGHATPGTWGEVARQDPGVNANTLTPTDVVDDLSGTAVLNGVPVTLVAAS